MQILHQVAAKADDLEKSITFYRQTLGIKLIAYFEQPGLAFFDLDGTRLLLEQNASPATLYFQVADIQGAYEELTSKGVKFMGPPNIIYTDDSGIFGPRGHNEWMCFFNDPSGNVLALACQQAPD
jgi:methylmalonyl-CoA/ethylmalonyl-CoA epimerase